MYYYILLMFYCNTILIDYLFQLCFKSSPFTTFLFLKLTGGDDFGYFIYLRKDLLALFIISRLYKKLQRVCYFSLILPYFLIMLRSYTLYVMILTLINDFAIIIKE